VRLQAKLLFLLIASSACAPEGRVAYDLSWNLDRIEFAASGAQWEVTTDRDFRVRVDGGYINSHSVELLPCEPEALRQMSEGQSWFVRPAAATHLPSLNPTSFHSARVESLTDLRVRRTVQRLAPGAAYCEAHYLIARADDASRGLPMEMDLLGKTLYVHGAVLSADGSQVPFELVTASANGLRVDIPELAPGTSDVVIRIERRLGMLFDGIDFNGSASRAWTRQILANLIAATSVDVKVAGLEAS